ncbi:MAG: SOS response-associated peptidase [Phycisphaerales bacterium]
MCGRFTHLFTWRQLHDLYDIHRIAAERDVDRDIERAELPPSYNVAPTQAAPIIRLGDDGVREGTMARWGLIPPWADDAKAGIRAFNARSETIATSPMFRSAFRSRRCVVPVSSFYEWQAIDGAKAKQPWNIFRADGQPLLLAGLWERWTKGGAPVDSFTIATCAPNAFMARLHDRMPCVLEGEHLASWLDPATTTASLQAMLAPAADGVLDAHRVSSRVGSVRNNDASLVGRVD